MSRDLDPALESAIEEQVVRPFMAVFIDLPDPVWVWTGVGMLPFNDADGNPQEWLGAGHAPYSIDTIGEATDGSAQGVRVALSQIPAEFREDIALQAVRGVAFEVYVGALNETMQAVTATNLLWKGRLDEYKVSDAGDSITVEITGESRGIDQRRPSIKRFTNEYHQRLHPGDKFFEYVPQMVEVAVLWGAASQNSTTAGGGGAGFSEPGGGAGGYSVSYY
jgi:hypothetical protein